MASSNNLAAIDPWMFRSSIADPFYPADAFARETESALTKALQQSLFDHQQKQQQQQQQSFFNHQNDYNYNYSSITASASTVTGSGSGSLSGSEPETPGSKRRGSNLLGVGKPTKRKSRASKRSTTTFIQADAANFRQMVQQVTGVKLGNGHLPVSAVVKPEPLRQPFMNNNNRLQGLLPTLDTSAYLLNNTHLPVSGTNSSAAPGFSQLSRMNHTAEDGGAGDFYSFSSFPTLESSI